MSMRNDHRIFHEGAFLLPLIPPFEKPDKQRRFFRLSSAAGFDHIDKVENFRIQIGISFLNLRLI